MHDYTIVFQICDKVLALFTDNNPRIDQVTIYLSVKGYNDSQILIAIKELCELKCISKDENASSNYYTIQSKGLHIKSNGGFRQYLNELNRKEELKQLLDDYSLKTNQSVIDTNKLVGQNVKTQERLTKYALTIAFFAALFPAITLVKDILQPQQLIDKDTQQTMKKQQESIQRLQQSLDSLNLSIKNLKTISYKIDTTKKK
jgi:hypothetical protein